MAMHRKRHYFYVLINGVLPKIENLFSDYVLINEDIVTEDERNEKELKRSI